MDEHSDERLEITEALRQLPLLDDLFLGMQAMNVDLADEHLEQLEAELAAAMMASDRPPLPAMMLVSALSQMWVFAAYELLRTWRDRACELIRWQKQLARVSAEGRDAAIAEQRKRIRRRSSSSLDLGTRWQLFEQAVEDEFIVELRAALNRSERAFRNLEAVRVWLAKHEVPRSKRQYAVAAGYGRFDQLQGTIAWMPDLGDGEVGVWSRRDLADGLREIAEPNARILPLAIQDALEGTPTDYYGGRRLIVTLDDGTEYSGVHVLWATEVVRVEGEAGLPFKPDQIVAVRPDPSPEPNGTDALF